MSGANNDWLHKAQRVSRDVLAKHAADVDENARWPHESISALTEEGLLGLTVPGEFGGAGQRPSTFAHVVALLAEQCASTAMIYLMHVCGACVIEMADAFEQRDAVLAEIARGRHLTTLAFSEKGSRSHFWAPVSQAERNGNGFVVSADKSWVTSADHADSYVVSTRAAGKSEPTATTLFLVDKGTDGLNSNGAWNGLGLRGNASAPMQLKSVKLAASRRLSTDGEGFQVMLNVVLPWFQLGNAAVSLGIARAATNATREHLLASKLQHLGQNLASLMNLRARLAQMKIMVDTLEAFIGRVAKSMENPGDQTMLAILESKAAAAETALQVTDLAMRTCGGAAFSKHTSVERHFRDARAGAVMAPTTDVLYDFIGKAMLDMPLF